MNKDQFLSLVRTILKLAGSALVTHGATKAAALINAEDVTGLILAIAGVVFSHMTHTNDTSSKPADPVKVTPTGPLLFLFLLSIGLFAGCGKATLAPGGAYAPAAFTVVTNDNGTTSTNVTLLQAPDSAFYAVDSAFEIAYNVTFTALKFERDNRVALYKLDPNIKHTLDKVRPVAWQVVQGYTRARAVYIANPTPAGLTQLETWLSKIQALSQAAATAIQPKN